MSAPLATVTGIPLPQIPHDVLIEQKQGQAIQIWTIGAFCIFGWELILCLPQEYRLVWKRPMNLSSAFYLANRYFGLVHFAVALISEAWTSSACKRIFFFKPVAGLISTMISQMILGGRVYAIFSKNNTIGFSLLAILTAEAILCGIAISTIVPPPPLSGPAASSQPPCGSLTGPFSWLVTFWTMPLLFDAVAFFLTAWKAYDLWKKQMNIGTHGIFSIIWRDGLLYFFAIFSMNTVNVIIFLTTPQALRAVNLPATLVLEIVLSCRLVLNLRASHARFISGSNPNIPKWSDTVKLHSVALPGTSSREKSIQVHGFDKAAENPTDVPETDHSPDNKIGPLQETWSAV